MKITSVRRLAAAALATTLAAGTVLAVPSAQAAPVPPNSYAYSAARWLADQLTDGIVVAGGQERYGQTLDVFFTLDGLGVREGTAASILTAFETKQTSYTTGEAFGDTGSHYAGATAKLATAVYAAGDDPTAFGGHDLVDELTDLVQTTGPDVGRVSDESLYGDNSNAIGQSFAVRALSAAASPLLADATAYLLKQQCADGSFRTFMYTAEVADDPSTEWDDSVPPVDRVCGEGDNTTDDSISVDTTTYAVQALLTAQDNGATGLDDDIAEAVAWLKGQQAADGSYEDLGNANASSTGLAAATLKLAGEAGPAGSAASWLVARQVTDAVGEDTALANELGAIAPDSETLEDGKTSGITTAERIRWVIATAQAALGVNAQLPATTLTVTAPTAYVQGGRAVTVSVSGLVAGEKFTASLSGGSSVGGTANGSGGGSVQVTTPSSTGNRTLTVTGSRAARKGTATVRVLGARQLWPRVKYSSITRGKTQTVTVAGLAAGETVKVYVSSKLIKTSTASSTGTYSRSFNVGSSRGKKTVKITGAFSNRTGSKTYTVK